MVDIHHYEQQYLKAEQHVRASSLSDRNKALLLEYRDACLLHGVCGKVRLIRTFDVLARCALKISMSILADLLAQLLDRTVRDDTGISGDFDVKLNWGPGQTADMDGPSIFTALQEQLGLKLNAQKGPVEILIIDSAERPSGN